MCKSWASDAEDIVHKAYSSQFATCLFAPPAGSFVYDFNTQLT